MCQRQADRQLFLREQQLSQLTGIDDPEECKFYLFGDPARKPSAQERRTEPQDNPWKPIENRDDLGVEAAVATPTRKRVCLVCDAGLGKTTNMEWLAARIAGQAGGQQVPLLLELDLSLDLKALVEEHKTGDGLAERLAGLIQQKAGGERRRHLQAIRRLQASGRITLLFDGLDHVLGNQEVFEILQETLASEAWRECPVWISGRPYAFQQCWETLFDRTDRPVGLGGTAALGWHFLRVEPLGEQEIRRYMRRYAAGDWLHLFPPETFHLLAVPRLLGLICGIIARALTEKGALNDPARAVAIVEGLELRTAADVYRHAYFHDGNAKLRNTQGLLGQGVHITNKDGVAIGGRKPTPLNYPKRIERTGVLLGAIAYEMFAMHSQADKLEPNTSGVNLDPFQDDVAGRLAEADQGTAEDFERDLDLLRQMNNLALEGLLFREASKTRLVFHDRTVQAFFAACWATKFGTADDRETMKRWVVDTAGKTLKGFEEFWTFAAEMPNALVDRDCWLSIFKPCYASPQQLKGSHDWVQWHRRMIYHSFARMQERLLDTIIRWRGSFLALAKGTAKQQRIHQEIEGGFQVIPEGVCLYGADPLDGREGIEREVKVFALHQWLVTNEMYEEFDAEHRTGRWVGEHPLAKKGKQGDDRCPVVMVTCYDAWCFAAWCGRRLPTELEWEHACRAGSATSWCFGDAETELAKYAWYALTSYGSTYPVGELAANKNDLYDMHGNVWEWCEDSWAPEASARVLRGGSWNLNGRYCRSAYRDRSGPEYRLQDFGFRLAAVPASLEPSRAS